MELNKIIDSELSAQKRFHADQPDIPALSAEQMKRFMDYIPREVIIPKINEIIDSMSSDGTEDTGDADAYADGITERYTKGIWKVTRYKSGIVECRAVAYVTIYEEETYGQEYYSYPVMFGEYNISVTPTEMSWNLLKFPRIDKDRSGFNISINALNATSYDADYCFEIFVKGTEEPDV